MAPSPIEAKLARLRGAIKADLDKLPNLPEPKPEVKATTNAAVYGPTKPAAEAQHKPAPKSNLGSIIWPDVHQPDSDSDDSEADCHIEFVRVEEDQEKIKEVEKDDSSDDHEPAVISPIKKGNLVRGELAPLGQAFVAIIGFSKFPYKYIHPDDSENVANRFFNAGKFFMREWHL
jgi:hypothetical protein